MRHQLSDGVRKGGAQSTALAHLGTAYSSGDGRIWRGNLADPEDAMLCGMECHTVP